MPAKPTESRWTGVEDLRTQSQKAWDKGLLLRELLEPTDTYPRRRPLKHPTAAELRNDYPAARAWAGELNAAAKHFSLETAVIGRTTIGANHVPAAAIFMRAQDDIAFLHKTRQADRFLALTRQLTALDPALAQWAARKALRLLDLGENALTAARVALWFRDHPDPNIYLRQLSLPGVHTKFVESHRRTIDEMVAVLDPQRAPLGTGFEARHGFLVASDRVRFRMLDPHIPLFGQARDVTVTGDAFRSLDLPVRTVLATENLANFLALPEQPGTLALFGAGYGFSALHEADWLRRCDIYYWGDLDTHGFRILDQLRASHPHVHSVLMDIETLLEHQHMWGEDAKRSPATLTRLTPAEADVYNALLEDNYGTAVRLEQEHVRWDWALKRLSRC